MYHRLIFCFYLGLLCFVPLLGSNVGRTTKGAYIAHELDWEGERGLSMCSYAAIGGHVDVIGESKQAFLWFSWICFFLHSLEWSHLFHVLTAFSSLLGLLVHVSSFVRLARGFRV